MFKSQILVLRQTVREDSIQLTCEQIQENFQVSPDNTYTFSPSFSFGVKCQERVICGGGQDILIKFSGSVYEWKSNNFIGMKPLKVGRNNYCSCVYVPLNTKTLDGVLIVAGGYHISTDIMEYLVINDSYRSNDWRFCRDKLPCKTTLFVQMNILNNKLILIEGGEFGTDLYNMPLNANLVIQLWEGNISFEEELGVKWTPLASMLEYREDYVSVVIDDKLFCIGGSGKKSTEYFSFTNNSWKKGPDLPFTLSGAKGVVSQSTYQCFIVGGNWDNEPSSKVFLFDPKKGLVDVQGEMDEKMFSDPKKLFSHIAVLL